MRHINNCKLILASTSPRRQQLLKKIALNFEIVAPVFNEKHNRGESPEEYVKRNSVGKAIDVASRVAPSLTDDFIVIGADTVVAIDDSILEKPKSKQQASDMLNLLSNRSHKVFTGVTVVLQKNPVRDLQTITFAVATTVYFKPITQDEIDAYILTDEPMDKAGAYAAQGEASRFIEKIDGSLDNVIGLPIEEIKKLFLIIFSK